MLIRLRGVARGAKEVARIVVVGKGKEVLNHLLCDPRSVVCISRLVGREKYR